ncbi:class I SAM-dependent methyltransferase [Roseovarius salis]|uniref:class I SAM-dependent methyltransferase n=1 Tax=Roseovarius salis TaxID=3376063 RepID=UPI0037C95FEB
MIRKYAFGGDDVAADIREKYGYDGDLAEIYATNRDYEVHKWHHYIPLYDRYFAKYRDTPVRFLEIGVAKGGSLQMWRRFLGDRAVLYGVDVRKSCARFDGLFGQVRIGSQDDPEFLSRVVEEMGGVDVVLDDGSHRMSHIEASLRALYPCLSEGGTYMIEDLHAAYWKGHEGGFDVPENFFNTVRGIIDDMHRRYHRRKLQVPALDGAVSGLHVHDSIVVIEKGRMPEPTHSRLA